MGAIVKILKKALGHNLCALLAMKRQINLN